MTQSCGTAKSATALSMKILSLTRSSWRNIDAAYEKRTKVEI
jgi:hypothetical protein